MAWTYAKNNPLTRVASVLYQARPVPCALSPFIFMTDPKRLDDIVGAVRSLPSACTVIYRHFGAADKKQMAVILQEICAAKDIQFLISADEDLAEDIDAHGLHLPERLLPEAKGLRARRPHWLLSGAVHNQDALQRADGLGLDGLLLSPVFASESPGAGAAIGAEKFAHLLKGIDTPVFALGGIDQANVQQLVGTGAAGIAGISAFTGGFEVAVIKLDDSFVQKLADLHRQNFATSWPKADFTAHIKNKYDDVLGITCAGDLHGFIITRCQGGQMEILTLVTAKQKRRQNLAHALVMQAQKMAIKRGADIIFLEVARDNIAATALYEKLGFIRYGTRPGYYKTAQGRVDAHLFQKRLTRV